MKETWTLARRELNAAFDSPTAYVVLFVFLLITGWFFGNGLFLEHVASLRTVFSLAPIIFMFFVPAITMASFAEERRGGTLELLLTLPVRDWQVILGKLLAVTILLWTAIGLTAVYALTIAGLGNPDNGAVTGGYLGLMLLSLAYGAIGMFSSSLTRNQIVAFVIGFALIFTLFMLDKITAFLPGAIGGLLEYLSIDFHYQNLLRGVIDSRDILYYLSVTLVACLLTAYNLARRPE